MTDLERFLNLMDYKPVDRCVYGVMTGQWPETYQRWLTEGLDPANPPVFPVDRWSWQSGWFFPNPPFERKTVEEDENIILYINHEGILMRERKDNPYSSMPQFVRFPVETREEFKAFCKERFQPDLAARIGENYAEELAACRDRDYPLVVISDRWGGMFGGLRNFVGVENACTLFYDDPAFVEEMMDAVADFIIAMMARILDHTSVDVYGFWEDMAYKTGPLVSPEMMRKYALPRYRRGGGFVKSRGVKHVSLDSDGLISSLIPVWMDAGIDILYPFEAQCGMDVIEVRREYGKELRMWGGINKHALAISPEAIDAELARVRPLVEEGGYVPALDHSMPPDVPFANYLYYMKKLRKLVNA